MILKAPMKVKHHINTAKEKIRMCNIGRKHTLQTKLKMSISKKGIKNPKLGRNMFRENNPMYGKHHTEKSKEKNRLSHFGKYDGNKNPNYGKKHSYITRQKISKSLLGIPSPMKGKHHTNESKEKLSISHRDKTTFNFKNIKTNEIFIGNSYDFSQKFNFPSGNVRPFAKGKIKHFHNWIIF